MDDFKRIVAENITALRTAAGMTQAVLGEKLNYSDKSVSKWERGESLPDAYVLKNIAELFGVTVDYLLSEHTGEDIPQKVEKPRRYSRAAITMVVLAGIWALAVLLFVVFWLTGSVHWIIFVYAIPVSLVTMLVLNSVWGTPRTNLYIISGIVWGIICSIYLSFLQENWWQLFLLGIPAQIIVVLSFAIKRQPKNK